MLAVKRLKRETQLARGESTVQHITAIGKAEAIGPTLWLSVTVEGVLDDMVDSGSESTIISLHQMFHHYHQLGLSELS